MFIINTSEGPVDVDNPETRQECYNKMMDKCNPYKEKTMFTLEVDFIMLSKKFKTLAEIQPWIQIALDAGANVVAIWCKGKLIEAQV